MKKVALLLICCSSWAISLIAQDTATFLQRQMGKGVEPAPMQLNADIYPFLFLEKGWGGSVSLGFSNWQVGIIGFGVEPPDFIVNTFFENTDNIEITDNLAAEFLVNYYLRKDRKGIYFSLLGGPEWFDVESNDGAKETIVKTYLVPRTGFRVFPFKEYFYIEPSIGWSFNLSGTEERTLGQATYKASPGGLIYFLQIGARFKLNPAQ